MSLDTDLLRSMRIRWRFKERASNLPLYIFDQKTRFLIGEMSLYFRTFKDCEAIDKDTFIGWLFERRADSIKETDKLLYKQLLLNFDKPLTEEAEQFLTSRITDADVVYRLMDIAERFNDGEEIDVGEELQTVTDIHRTATRVSGDDDAEVTVGVTEILESSGAEHGLLWPFAVLNDAMRPAQWGDNIIVAARPDVGKTSFLAACALSFAQQLPELEPDDNRPVLWLNNEGPGSRVKLRLWQCALRATLPELSDRSSAGTLEQAYAAVAGDSSRIRIFDIHGWSTAKVERLIERVRPAAIIWDMADHIRYTGDAKVQAARTDEYLEGLYNWIRETGVRHHAVNLVSTQLSGDAENVGYPLLGMLKDSKTGKQGTADAIITIGFIDIKPTTRSLGLTKNKLNKGNSKGGGRKLGELAFDGARGYFYVPSEVESD